MWTLWIVLNVKCTPNPNGLIIHAEEVCSHIGISWPVVAWTSATGTNLEANISRHKHNCIEFAGETTNCNIGAIYLVCKCKCFSSLIKCCYFSIIIRLIGFFSFSAVWLHVLPFLSLHTQHQHSDALSLHEIHPSIHTTIKPPQETRITIHNYIQLILSTQKHNHI
jgi:hypothetical protein